MKRSSFQILNVGSLNNFIFGFRFESHLISFSLHQNSLKSIKIYQSIVKNQKVCVKCTFFFKSQIQLTSINK